MPVIGLIDAPQAPLLARPYYTDGDPGPIVAALAHVPELLEVTIPFVSVALGPSALDARTKEIVIVRTSALLACRYCVDTHTPIASGAGLDHLQVRALRGEVPWDGAFSASSDLALIPWVDAVAAGRGPVPAELTARLLTHVAEHELVELTVLVGATMMLNRLATTLELPVSTGTTAALAELGFAGAGDAA